MDDPPRTMLVPVYRDDPLASTHPLTAVARLFSTSTLSFNDSLLATSSFSIPVPVDIPLYVGIRHDRRSQGM